MLRGTTVRQLEVTPGCWQSSEDHAVLGLKLEHSAQSLKPSLGSVIPALGLDSDSDPFFLSYKGKGLDSAEGRLRPGESEPVLRKSTSWLEKALEGEVQQLEGVGLGAPGHPGLASSCLLGILFCWFCLFAFVLGPQLVVLRTSTWL